MCGICGTAHPTEPAARPVIEAMCAAMTYRGPDDDGFLLRGGVGLGMRRLSIIDLQTGSQPIFNESGSVGVVFNGEIYNYRKLRDSLREAGHTFSTDTDTEVIVHGYEEYGPAIVEKLNGMFAFALYDESERRLLLARDRTGQKPLFYHHRADGALVFASELPTLLASGLVPRDVDPTAIWHYLSTQYIMGPGTVLQGVCQLPAAHYAVWQAGELSLHRYWEPHYEPDTDRTPGQWEVYTRSTVRAAVERHMIADVPLGAYLSGGVDSSIVVALMAAMSPQPVRTFSIGFDVETYSETDHARRIAERFGTDHHEFTVTANMMTDVLEDVVQHAGQPLADTSLMATYLLARLTRDHVTVALTGDGGDEAFAGYTRYTLDRLLRVYRLLPGVIRRSLVPALGALLPENPDIPTDRNIVTGIRRLAQASDTSHKASILAWGSFFTEDGKHAIAAPDWLASFDNSPTPSELAAVYDAAHAHTHRDRTLATDIQTYLQHDLLVKADRMSMARSLETRAPFLDNEVLALGMSMPVDMRLRGRSQKWILRRAFADYLPPENTNRVKRGFGMPVASWLRGHMAGYVRDILLSQTARERGYFRPGAVESLIDAHASGAVDHGQRIWALLCLELWHRRFIDTS